MFSVNGSLPTFCGSSLGTNSEGIGGDGAVFIGAERHDVRKVSKEDVAELDFHGWADVDLKAEDSFEGAAFGIEVDEVGGLVVVDPVLVMVSANEDAVVMPDVWFEFFDGNFSGDP